MLLLSTGSFAQSADFLILKKKDKTVQRFFAGDNIAFMTKTGAYVDARINQMKDDTLFLQQFVVQQLPTTFGGYILDTVGSYHYKYHYNQISAFGAAKKHGFDWKGSGGALLGGGALLTLGSGIVYLADRQKFSAPLLIAAVGLGTVGYFLAKGGNKGMVIGKKYQLEYVNMQNKK